MPKQNQIITKELKIKDILGKRGYTFMFVDADPTTLNLAASHGNTCMHITDEQYYELTEKGE